MPELKLGRDLHQGDPLSPYLFIIIVDVLSSIISFHVENGDLSGVKLDPFGLLYASGQATNLDKSYLYFSANASVEVKDEVSSLLGINDCANLENYLGLPMIMCRSKIEALTFVKERVSKKVARKGHKASWAWSSILKGKDACNVCPNLKARGKGKNALRNEDENKKWEEV
ncbi:reverse transcriptase [Senna tora]|uniref:Reverse transcriptase n=1 Tax=Senna tora TaxID=362788 RepID=A0A834SQH8_9FABA|nr:reverse transcriptase [Senna tora]